jgi:hypothetical protein
MKKRTARVNVAKIKQLKKELREANLHLAFARAETRAAHDKALLCAAPLNKAGINPVTMEPYSDETLAAETVTTTQEPARLTCVHGRVDGVFCLHCNPPLAVGCVWCEGDPDDGYDSLRQVFEAALLQASRGKGKERHASDGESFEQQQIVRFNDWMGSNHFTVGQAVKKAIESTRLEPARARAELLGAIVYLAAAHMSLPQPRPDETA